MNMLKHWLYIATICKNSYSNKASKVTYFRILVAWKLLLPQNNIFSSLFILNKNASYSLQFISEVEAVSSCTAIYVSGMWDQSFQPSLSGNMNCKDDVLILYDLAVHKIPCQIVFWSSFRVQCRLFKFMQKLTTL